MKKMSLSVLLFVMALTMSFPPWIAQGAERDSAEKKGGEVSLPWDEFKTLLRLDAEEIELTVEEFTSLLRQTKAEQLPSFVVEKGRIVLSREEFKRLLGSMQAPQEGQEVGDYLVSKAAYKATVKEDTTAVEAELSIQIFPPKHELRYVIVPLFPREVALSGASLDGKPALLMEHGGRHALAIREAGLHSARFSFNIATDLKKGPQAVQLPIPETPITLLSLSLPIPSVEAEIQGAKAVASRAAPGGTLVEAVLSPTSLIQVGWSRVIPEEEKGPAKLYADLYHLLSVEDDALRVTTIGVFNILQNTINNLTLRVPRGYQILNVSGGPVGDWKEKTAGERNLLEIALKSPTQGMLRIQINAERLFAEKETVADFNGFEVVDCVREKGFLAIELKSSAEVKIPEAKGIDRVSFPELPAELVGHSEKPLIFAYKYLRHPYALTMEVQKHEELPVISTVIDNASAMTLFTEDGKRVHQVTYSVRNTWKQFMELSLPKDAQLWSAFVQGRPVKPSRNADGKILIPLNRSREGDSGLAAFDVELIYFQKARKFGWFGRKSESFVVPDVMISRILWSVYLPVDYRFLHFGGTMEKEKIARGVRPFLGVNKRVISLDSLKAQQDLGHQPIPSGPSGAGDDESQLAELRAYNQARIQSNVELLRKEGRLKSEFGQSMAVGEEEVAAQLAQEMDFGGKVAKARVSGAVAGILPIRVEIPAVGQLYRFAEQIVSEETPDINFTYVDDHVIGVLKIIVLLLIVWLIYRRRDRLKQYFRLVWDWYAARKNQLAWLLGPLGIMISAVALFFLAGFFLHSPAMMALFLVLFLFAVVRYLVHWRHTRKRDPEEGA